ncbi:MAG: DNA alkylation repair protein [Selenomonas sp.]|uniref:DNA alkylation repair protein n=1 Tax=Selenomonas sp. TaxID=2053611 RepID=UPI0025F76E98|nr:DNA alkylation repair protein [Selenomonas sp.]MCR5758557.1 DNA alkylation repair protein [Selenomonas sp.]
MNIEQELFRQQDKEYGAFQRKLMPTVAPETVIGVRTPLLRDMARALSKNDGEVKAFLEKLPHRYFEENQLHAFILSEMKDYETCIKGVVAFLPYVNNWATCDQLSPKIFKKHRQALLVEIKVWLSSQAVYTVRFAIGMLMTHFLDEDFTENYLSMVVQIRSEEYYVNMMIAWYFATALAKQYEKALPFIEEQRLERWTHNKAIQKAIESRRIGPEQKAYLRNLKIR